MIKLELLSPNFYLKKIDPNLTVISLLTGAKSDFDKNSISLFPGIVEGLILFLVCGVIFILIYVIFKRFMTEAIR
jgi:hypothetical protein